MKIQRILHLLTLKQSSFPHEVGISISICSRVRVIGGGDLIIKCENRFFGVGITTPPPNILPLSLKALPPVYTEHATKQPMPSFWLSPYRSSQFHTQLSNPETHPFQVSSKPTWTHLGNHSWLSGRFAFFSFPISQTTAFQSCERHICELQEMTSTFLVLHSLESLPFINVICIFSLLQSLASPKSAVLGQNLTSRRMFSGLML